MQVLSVAEVPDNTQPRNFTPLEIKGQTIRFWDLDIYKDTHEITGQLIYFPSK